MFQYLKLQIYDWAMSIDNKIHFINEMRKQKLEEYIEIAQKKSKWLVSDEPLFICNSDDVTIEELVNHGRIYIAFGKIYLSIHGSVVFASWPPPMF